MNSNTHYLFFICILLALTGCAAKRGVSVEERSTTAAIPAAAPVEEKGQAVQEAGADIEAQGPYTQFTKEQTGQHPAVIALLDESDRKLNEGMDEAAIASIERAIRLEPKNAVLWHRLAAIRLQQDNSQQALAMAHKSNSLAPDDKQIQAANWDIIARAKADLGDSKGALEAKRIADALRRKTKR